MLQIIFKIFKIVNRIEITYTVYIYFYKIAVYAAFSGCSKNSAELGASHSTGQVHSDVYTQTILNIK